MNNKKLFIVNKKQFGYHLDTYKYCQHLHDNWIITYNCFDTGFDRFKLNKIKVNYISWEGKYIFRAIRYFLKILKLIKFYKPDIILIINFEFCFLLKLLAPKFKYILDIRTGSIHENIIRRFLYNSNIKINSLFFKNITIISYGLAQKLKINKFHILPLGADIASEKNKKFNDFKLLYIGTLRNRNIHETLMGLAIFIKQHPDLNIEYNIFGGGTNSEEKRLRNHIANLKIAKIVKFHGYKPHKQIISYFNNSNIGISYVPTTQYFKYQPPTKTFEYVLSGMACIATNTYENEKLISIENGVLCNDNAISFSEALEKIYQNKEHYNSNTIRNTLKKYTWSTITKTNLNPYLLDIING